MKRSILIPILAVLLAGLALGFYQLFKTRYETGDVYAPYSSLRADPLGTMALFESLESIAGLQVKRDHSDANQLPAGRKTVYLHLAAPALSWLELPESLFKEIDSFMLGGGRLVVTLLPESREFTRRKPAIPKLDEEEALTKERTFTTLEKWGIELTFVKPGSGSAEGHFAELFTELPLPSELVWHGGTILTNLSDRWKVIYALEDRPVLAERSFGPGSLVIATDTFFLSNEALRSDREPQLLAWLIGNATHVVFDEAHLGIVEQTGVSTLMRRYRLYGIILAALIVAALFIWKNALPFLPRRDEQITEDTLEGRDIAVGFNNLLRRNIASGELLKTCLAQFEKAHTGGTSRRAPGRSSALEVAHAIVQTQDALPARQRNAVEAYREICAALSRKSPAPSSPPKPSPEI